MEKREMMLQWKTSTLLIFYPPLMYASSPHMQIYFTISNQWCWKILWLLEEGDQSWLVYKHVKVEALDAMEQINCGCNSFLWSWHYVYKFLRILKTRKIWFLAFFNLLCRYIPDLFFGRFSPLVGLCLSNEKCRKKISLVLKTKLPLQLRFKFGLSQSSLL